MNRNDCIEALSKLYEYLDGELAEQDSAKVKQHMEVCQGCYPFLQFCSSFQDAVHRAAHGQLAAPPPLRSRIADLLRAEGVPPTH
jgi:anti-sigma factor (TIGR02949 family)